MGTCGLDPGWGRSPGGGHGNPLQYSCLRNPMDREAWWATAQRVAKSWTRLRDYAHTSFYLYNRKLVPLLEKEMAPHSSTLAQKIPQTEEPRRLQSTGLERVGYN